MIGLCHCMCICWTAGLLDFAALPARQAAAQAPAPQPFYKQSVPDLAAPVQSLPGQ